MEGNERRKNTSDIDYMCDMCHIDEILNSMTEEERMLLALSALKNFSIPKQKDGRQMDFEKVKELLKEAVDEGNTIAEIMQITADKIYQQGVKDGEQDDG